MNDVGDREFDDDPSGQYGGDGEGKEGDMSQHVPGRGGSTHSSVGGADSSSFSVGTYSTDGGSLHSSDGESVRSDHAQDYCEGNDCSTDYGGGAKSNGTYPNDDGYAGAGDDDSEASSIQSLQSCEIIAALKNKSSGGKDSHIESYYEEDHSYYSEGSGDSLLNDDDSLGFPPGHITRLDELDELNALKFSNAGPEEKSSITPSIIPSYFFCPIANMIMKDPVITPDGHTFERRAILRFLILEPVDPITKNPLSHEELVEDYLVKQAIDKARKEAWVRYVVEFKDEDVDRIIEQEKIEESSKTEVEGGTKDQDADYKGDKNRDHPLPQPLPSQRGAPPTHKSIDQYDVPNNLSFDTSSSPTVDTSAGNHGWSVPLGVHEIICTSPGLVVTTDVHRRSGMAKRKIIKKSLVEDGKTNSKGKQKANSKMKLKRKNSKKMRKNLKTTTSVITRNLILPPGSHVEILETRVHGGRVRGRIIWEEEVATEMDPELSLLFEEEKAREKAMARPQKPRAADKVSSIPKKGKPRGMFFRRKSNCDEHEKKLPFTSELFDRPPHHSPAVKLSRSLSPLTTIKYSGWISLQWAGTANNSERDEVLRRGRSAVNVSFIADEDEGPWSRPLPLGVYRISGDATAVGNAGSSHWGTSVKQLPLCDAPNSESNIIDFLVCNQCLEVIETQVMVMKRKDRDQIGMHLSNTEGMQVVRARCMVPVIVAPLSVENFVGGSPVLPQRKFRSGWITISEGKNSVTACPIPIGAYIVTTKDPLLSCDSNSKIKSILPSGSCMEVDATRIEFEEKEEMMKCGSCGRESMFHTVAVRALIASGGYVTLFVVSVGVSGTHGSLCACGRLVQQTYADPVPLGTYRITHSTYLTQGSGHKTPAILQLKENAFVRVIETRVESGCVRGRVNIDVSNGNILGVKENPRRKESMTGWVSLFEPPSFSWAELTSTAAA